MKTTAFYNSLLSVIMLIAFSSCSSSQKLEQKTPFIVQKPIAQNWYGGRPESGNGIKVSFTVKNMPEGVSLDSLYFRGMKAAITTESTSDAVTCVANFVIKPDQKSDMVMHSDPKKEFGNTIPKPKHKIPFKLKEDEAVLKYIEGNTEKFFKISGIVQKAPINYN